MSIGRSGIDTPFSHFDMVLLDIDKFFATSSCVTPLSVRSSTNFSAILHSDIFFTSRKNSSSGACDSIIHETIGGVKRTIFNNFSKLENKQKNVNWKLKKTKKDSKLLSFGFCFIQSFPPIFVCQFCRWESGVGRAGDRWRRASYIWADAHAGTR